LWAVDRLFQTFAAGGTLGLKPDSLWGLFGTRSTPRLMALRSGQALKSSLIQNFALHLGRLCELAQGRLWLYRPAAAQRPGVCSLPCLNTRDMGHPAPFRMTVVVGWRGLWASARHSGTFAARNCRYADGTFFGGRGAGIRAPTESARSPASRGRSGPFERETERAQNRSARSAVLAEEPFRTVPGYQAAVSRPCSGHRAQR
jgi:hypothetical protein